MSHQLTVSAEDAPTPLSTGDVWPVTTLVEVALTDDGHWITRRLGRNPQILLESDDLALAVAAALVASVEKRRAARVEDAA